MRRATPAQRADRGFVIAALAEAGADLRHASKQLRNDREVVQTAVRQDGAALCHASPELRADQETVLAAVEQDGGALFYAAKQLKADRGFVLAAVTRTGAALRYATAALKADKELVKAAIAQDPSALQYASAELQNDREVVHLATPPKAKLSGIDASQAVREARAAALELAATPVGLDLVLERRPSAGDSEDGGDFDSVRTSEGTGEAAAAAGPDLVDLAKSGSSVLRKQKSDRALQRQNTAPLPTALQPELSATEARARAITDGATTTTPSKPEPLAFATPVTPEMSVHFDPGIGPDSGDSMPGEAAALFRMEMAEDAHNRNRRKSSMRMRDLLPVRSPQGGRSSPRRYYCCDGMFRRIETWRGILVALLKCFGCIFCCLGLPVSGLIVISSGAVDCDDRANLECWKELVEVTVGIERGNCHSTLPCSEFVLAHDQADPQAAFQPAVWTMLDGATCVEGALAEPEPEPEPEGFESGSGSSSWFDDGSGSAGDGLLGMGEELDAGSESPARCVAELVTRSKAESVCRQRSARLCTGLELWRAGTGCLAPEDALPSPVWSRTPAALLGQEILDACPDVGQGEREHLFLAYSGVHPEDPSGDLLCLDEETPTALVRCCADTDTVLCEPDHTAEAYVEEDLWEDDGSWNVTEAEEEESEVRLVQLIGVTGGGSLVCCICLVWWVHAFYRVLRKHFRTKAEEAREEEERKERQEMKSYGDGTDPRIDTGDIEEQQVAQHRRDRSRSGMVVARLKGLTKSPRLSPSKWGKKRQRRWGTPSAGAPQGCSLSDLPESVRLAILSYTGGCIELARLCTVCKWWLDLHRKAAKHVDIRWSQWEQSDANPNAICLALPSYPRLVSVDIVADAPSTQHSCRTLPDPVDPRGPPTLVIGTCQALEALWEHASIRTLTLRTSPRVVSGGKHAYQSVYHAGRPADGGVKETGAVWMLDREFTRVVSRSRTLKNLDFRRSRFDQIPGWPASMETLCMQQCAQLQVFPGGTLRSLVSLDLSRCPLLHDISVLVGATKLHWLDLSGCSALSEISPIAGCAELETLNLNRCFNLREISALGTLKKLATLDMSSCPEVEGIVALASCTALARLDISHTHVPVVSCLAPVKRPDETHHQGCPQLAALTCRGCKCLDASDIIELHESLPRLLLDTDADLGEASPGAAPVLAHRLSDGGARPRADSRP